MNIDKAYMTTIIHKLVEDIKAKELDYCINGVKVQISFSLTEARILLEALKQADGLDKIRAEIESKEMIETTSEREFYNMALNDVLQIIDKYKAESEDKE